MHQPLKHLSGPLMDSLIISPCTSCSPKPGELHPSSGAQLSRGLWLAGVVGAAAAPRGAGDHALQGFTMIAKHTDSPQQSHLLLELASGHSIL